MNLFAQKIYVFLKKGFLMELSYRTNFFWMFFNVLFEVFVFYFIGLMVGQSATPYLSQFGGEYFPFVFIGIAFTKYSWTSINALSDFLRNEQMMGTLESLLSTPTSFYLTVVFSTLWRFVFTTVQVVICLLVGVLILGFSFEGANLSGAVVILALNVSSLIGLGIVAAGFTLVIKKGNFLGVVFSKASDVLSGVYFPLAVLPPWLKWVSALMPLKYSLEAMRLVLLNGYGLGQVLPQITALVVFSLVLIPLGLLFLKYSLVKAKVDGSLIQY